MLETCNAGSIRRRLIKQLTMVFALLGVIGAMGAYIIGDHHATQTYDQELSNDLATLASHMSLSQGLWVSDFTKTAERWLLANEGERVIYRVVDLTRHTVLLGNSDFPLSTPHAEKPGDGHFRTLLIHGDKFRVGTKSLSASPDEPPSLLIEIGETMGRRERLAQRLMGSMLLITLTIIGISAVIVWRNLSGALQPLHQLEVQVTQRAVTDLTPLDLRQTPTEIRSLLQAVNHMMDKVSQTMEGQSRFLANVAHQLRTPAAALRLHAQLAQNSTSPAAQQKHLNEIGAGTKRMVRVIEQLLALARAEATPPPLEEVDLMTVIRNVIERHLPSAGEQGVDLGFEGTIIPARTLGNQLLLEELLSNLVDNAIRYNQPGGTVSVSIESEKQLLTLRVVDDGPGMTQANDCYLRFQRGDAPNREGSGLGLAIVQEISNLHGATLSCQTAPSAGMAMAVSFKSIS